MLLPTFNNYAELVPENESKGPSGTSILASLKISFTPDNNAAAAMDADRAWPAVSNPLGRLSRTNSPSPQKNAGPRLNRP